MGTAARDLFERVRWRYFQVQPGVRPLAGVAFLVLAVAIAVVAHLPVLNVAVFAAILLVAVDLTMRSPVGMAVVAIIVCWLAVTVPLGRLYPAPEHQAVFLALLALPVAFVAFRLRGFAPWRTTLMVLAFAGIAAAATAHPLPRLHVAPAWLAAAVLLAYRWDQARRAVPAEAYDTGWVQEQPDREGVPPASGAYTHGVPAATQAAYEERAAGPDQPERRERQEPADENPVISVGEALDELEGMIGLEPVKRQVRS
ncbi:ATPase, partial [Actinomadura sp. HBU206391]|nr:ATPase [Actinomadura sp. HBU206391]